MIIEVDKYKSHTYKVKEYIVTEEENIRENLENRIISYKLGIVFLTLNHSNAFGIDQHDIELRRDLLENVIKQLESI